jgi:hypothetical protein
MGCMIHNSSICIYQHVSIDEWDQTQKYLPSYNEDPHVTNKLMQHPNYIHITSTNTYTYIYIHNNIYIIYNTYITSYNIYITSTSYPLKYPFDSPPSSRPNALPQRPHSPVGALAPCAPLEMFP